MQIPFNAYADDCTVNGEIALRMDRLSDLLSLTTEYEVEHPLFKALDDGREVSAESCAIGRDDLCLVLATGPRGHAERRVWTRQHAVRARVGPYTVLGYLHAAPTIDPLRMTDRRPIVALTACTVEYEERGSTIRLESEAVLINTAKIARLESATDQDLGVAAQVDIPTRVDARSKDMTHSS